MGQAGRPLDPARASLYCSALMRTAREPAKRIQPVYSKAQARRRRLHRGVEVWDADRRLCAEHTRRVAMITLTLNTDDMQAAHGLARDFWGRVRHRFLGVRYFCWLELQKRGRIHYHALWLNPPGRRRADLVHLVDSWWGHGRTQVRFQDAAWMDRAGVDYVYSYVKKQGSKYYQQQYEDLPREIRTFMSQRLEIPPAYLANHVDADAWAIVWDQLRPWEKPDFHLELVGRRGCLLSDGGPCANLRHAMPLIRRRRGKRRRTRTRADARRQLHDTLRRRTDKRRTPTRSAEVLPKSGRSG